MTSKPLIEKQFIRWKKMMEIFSLIFGCHQIKERSFIIRNRQMPLCARCTGFYSSLLILSPILCVFLPENIHLSIILTLPLIIDGETQFMGFRESNNILRLITGLLAGYGVMSLLFLVVEHTISLFPQV